MYLKWFKGKESEILCFEKVNFYLYVNIEIVYVIKQKECCFKGFIFLWFWYKRINFVQWYNMNDLDWLILFDV